MWEKYVIEKVQHDTAEGIREMLPSNIRNKEKFTDKWLFLIYRGVGYNRKKAVDLILYTHCGILPSDGNVPEVWGYSVFDHSPPELD